MRLYSSQAYEEMDFPPPLDTAPRSEAGSVSVEPSRNNESEVLAEPRGSFEAQMPLASNVAPDPQPQEGFLVDLAAVHSLPAAVAKKKRHAPVDDWDVEKPLIDTLPEALFKINERVLAQSAALGEGSREARVLKFNTKSIRRMQVILYRVHYRGLSLKWDEWLEEDKLAKHSPEAAAEAAAAIAAQAAAAAEAAATAKRVREEALARDRAVRQQRKSGGEGGGNRTSLPGGGVGSSSSSNSGVEMSRIAATGMGAGAIDNAALAAELAAGSGKGGGGARSKDHPPYHEMVKLAISELKDRTGSSLAAIVKWITANYYVPEDKCKKHAVVALKQAVAKKAVIKVKASYKLSAAAVKALSLRKRKEKQVAAPRVRTTKRRFPVPDALLDIDPELRLGRPLQHLPEPSFSALDSVDPVAKADLVMIWDFCRLYGKAVQPDSDTSMPGSSGDAQPSSGRRGAAKHANGHASLPTFTLDELQRAVCRSPDNTRPTLLAELNLGLLRALCGRRLGDGAPSHAAAVGPDGSTTAASAGSSRGLGGGGGGSGGEGSGGGDLSLPAARYYWGHFLNALTWPELLRRYVVAADQQSKDANAEVARQQFAAPPEVSSSGDASGVGGGEAAAAAENGDDPEGDSSSSTGGALFEKGKPDCGASATAGLLESDPALAAAVEALSQALALPTSSTDASPPASAAGAGAEVPKSLPQTDDGMQVDQIGAEVAHADAAQVNTNGAAAVTSSLPTPVTSATNTNLAGSYTSLPSGAVLALLKCLVNDALSLPGVEAKVSADATALQELRLAHRRSLAVLRRAQLRSQGCSRAKKRPTGEGGEGIMGGEGEGSGEGGAEGGGSSSCSSQGFALFGRPLGSEEAITMKEAEAAATTTAAALAQGEAKLTVRRECLGEDRFERAYWAVPGLQHVAVSWRQVSAAPAAAAAQAQAPTSSSALVSSSGEEGANKSATPALEEVWGCLTWVEELEQLRDALDERGIKEKALKEKLLAHWDLVAGLLKRKPKPEKPAAPAAGGGDGAANMALENAEDSATKERRVAKRAAAQAALVDLEPRRSSRVREEVKPFQATVPPPSSSVQASSHASGSSGAAAGAVAASDATSAALAAPVAPSEMGVAGSGGYIALTAPWRLASVPDTLDAVGCFKQELLALGSRTVRLLGPSVLGEAACATWRRDVKHAYDVRELGPSALLVENALYLLQNPGEGGPEAALLAEVMAELSDDEDDDDDEDDNNDGAGSNLPWQHFCGLLRGLPANKGRSVKELLDRAMAAAKSAPEPHAAVIARLNRALSLFRPSSAGAAKAAAVRALDELGDGPAKNDSKNHNNSSTNSYTTSADSGSTNGSSNSSTNEEAALEAAITKACSSALSALRAKSQAAWFAEPVDPDALGIPHYREIVPRPMDLGTVGSRLASGHYAVVAKAAAEAAKAHAEAAAAARAGSAYSDASSGALTGAVAVASDDGTAGVAADDTAAAADSAAATATDGGVSNTDASSSAVVPVAADAPPAAPPAVVVQTLDGAFASDVKLVFANARAFTPDTTATVHKSANSLEALFDAKFSAALARAKNGGSNKKAPAAAKKTGPPPPQPSRKSRRSGQGDDAAEEAAAVSVVATAADLESAPVPTTETGAATADVPTVGADATGPEATEDADASMQQDGENDDGVEDDDDGNGDDAEDEDEVGDDGEEDVEEEEEDDEGDAQKEEEDLEEEEDEMEEDADDGDDDDGGGSTGGGIARAAYAKALAAEAALLEAPGGQDPATRAAWREGCAAAAAAQGEAPFALHLYALADCARQVLPEVEEEVAAAQLLLNPAAECPSGPVRVATKPLVPLLATDTTAAKDSNAVVPRGPGRPRSSSSANINSAEIDVGIHGGHGSDLVWALDTYQWWPARLRRATDAKFGSALLARGEVLVVYLGEGEGHTYAVPLDHVAPFTGVDAAAVTAAAAAAAAAAVTGSHNNGGSNGSDAMELPPLDPHMPVLSASGCSPANRALKQAIKIAQALLKRHRAAADAASSSAEAAAEAPATDDVVPPVGSI